LAERSTIDARCSWRYIISHLPVDAFHCTDTSPIGPTAIGTAAACCGDQVRPSQ
jgi:hypothetical protein